MSHTSSADGHQMEILKGVCSISWILGSWGMGALDLSEVIGYLKIAPFHSAPMALYQGAILFTHLSTSSGLTSKWRHWNQSWAFQTRILMNSVWRLVKMKRCICCCWSRDGSSLLLTSSWAGAKACRLLQSSEMTKWPFPSLSVFCYILWRLNKYWHVPGHLSSLRLLGGSNMHTSWSHCYEGPNITTTGCLKDSWQINYEGPRWGRMGLFGIPCWVDLSCLSRLAGYLTHLGAC